MNNSLLEKIEYEYNSLSKTHRIIADLYINNQIKPDSTLIEVATLGYCSHSTVLRFIRIMGYKNFKVFMEDFFNTNTKVEKSLEKSLEIVDLYIAQNESSINALVKTMSLADNVYIFASGMSYLPAYNLYYKGNMVSNKFHLYNDFSGHINLTPNDFVIFISNSGNSRQLKVLSNSISDFHLITNYDRSKLSDLAECTYCLNNHIESFHKMDTRPRESIYSLLYFTDCVFSKFQNL